MVTVAERDPRETDEPSHDAFVIVVLFAKLQHLLVDPTRLILITSPEGGQAVLVQLFSRDSSFVWSHRSTR